MVQPRSQSPSLGTCFTDGSQHKACKTPLLLHTRTDQSHHQSFVIRLNSSYKLLLKIGLRPKQNNRCGPLQLGSEGIFSQKLARRVLQVGITNQKPLITAFPAHSRPQLGPIPRQPFVAYCHEIIDRIATKLASYQTHPGWAASDELDFASEAPRSLQPETVFCQPATWHEPSETLYYLNALPPNLMNYNHIISLIADGNRWIQAECYRAGGQLLFFLTTPPNAVARLLPLIQKLRSDLGANGRQHFLLHGTALRFNNIWFQANQQWAQEQPPEGLLALAQTLRRWHLLRISLEIAAQYGNIPVIVAGDFRMAPFRTPSIFRDGWVRCLA